MTDNEDSSTEINCSKRFIDRRSNIGCTNISPDSSYKVSENKKG